MSVKTLLRPLALFFFLLSIGTAQATVTFSSLFSNNMILQRGVSVHVWGTANEGEPATVTFNGQTAIGVGDASNSWSVTLAPMTALTAGTALSVQGSSNTVSYTNVVVGDIYLCSGQSNMDSVVLTACTPNGATDATTTNYPNIRMLHVNRDIEAAPVSDSAFTPGVWHTCTASTNSSGIYTFTGVFPAVTFTPASAARCPSASSIRPITVCRRKLS